MFLIQIPLDGCHGLMKCMYVCSVDLEEANSSYKPTNTLYHTIFYMGSTCFVAIIFTSSRS